MSISDYQEKMVQLVSDMEDEFGATVAEINIIRGTPETTYNGNNLELETPVVVSITFV